MTDKERIKAEIERLKIQNETYVDKEYTESEKWSKHGAYHVLFKLLNFIDSLPEEPHQELYDKLSKLTDDALSKETKESWNEFLNEPVSEELEEFALRYTGHHAPYDSCWQEVEDAVKAGAQWQKKQMMKDAINGSIFQGYAAITDKVAWLHGLRVNDKFKMIIIKDE